jgi:hypothetical protein
VSSVPVRGALYETPGLDSRTLTISIWLFRSRCPCADSCVCGLGGFRSMDTNKVLVGTGDDSILVYALPEETRQSRRSSRAVTASIVSDDDGDRGGEPL